LHLLRNMISCSSPIPTKLILSLTLLTMYLIFCTVLLANVYVGQSGFVFASLIWQNSRQLQAPRRGELPINEIFFGFFFFVSSIIEYWCELILIGRRRVDVHWPRMKSRRQWRRRTAMMTRRSHWRTETCLPIQSECWTLWPRIMTPNSRRYALRNSTELVSSYSSRRASLAECIRSPECRCCRVCGIFSLRCI